MKSELEEDFLCFILETCSFATHFYQKQLKSPIKKLKFLYNLLNKKKTNNGQASSDI